jgi:cytoplasmic iron level regulating protein YaaA (DUF328/UPF0246 family)
MRVLLPPSETKRDGGDAQPVDLAALSFSELTKTRRELVEAVVSLAGDQARCLSALKLGPKLAFEVERNRSLLTGPTLAAIDRYTGVLFDGLSASTLSAPARRDVLSSVVIQSALWGPIAAGDAIPAYRLSYNSSLPGRKRSLTATWVDACRELDGMWHGFVLDARSEGYADLMPLPATANGYFLRVATRDSAGATRALNHFNKKAKGEFVRALAESGSLAKIASVEQLCEWGTDHGWQLELGADRISAGAAGQSATEHEITLLV